MLNSARTLLPRKIILISPEVSSLQSNSCPKNILEFVWKYFDMSPGCTCDMVPSNRVSPLTDWLWRQTWVCDQISVRLQTSSPVHWSAKLWRYLTTFIPQIFNINLSCLWSCHRGVWSRKRDEDENIKLSKSSLLFSGRTYFFKIQTPLQKRLQHPDLDPNTWKYFLTAGLRIFSSLSPMRIIYQQNNFCKISWLPCRGGLESLLGLGSMTYLFIN